MNLPLPVIPIRFWAVLCDLIFGTLASLSCLDRLRLRCRGFRRRDDGCGGGRSGHDGLLFWRGRLGHDGLLFGRRRRLRRRVFRGRELTHPEIGRNLIARFVERVKDHGVAERTPLLEGKSMHITMASLHKPKSHDAPDRKHAPGVTPEDATAETPAAPEEKTVVAQPAAPEEKTVVARPAATAPDVPPAEAAAPEPEPVQAGE